MATSELVSPELALVDARLAVDARALLPDLDDTLTRLGSKQSLNRANALVSLWNVGPSSSTDDVSAALRRITELSEVEPPKKPRCRVGFFAVTVAWGAVVLVAADLELGLYTRLF